MTRLLKKTMLTLMALVLVIASLAGCSKPNNTSSSSSSSAVTSSQEDLVVTSRALSGSSSSTDQNSVASLPTQEDAQKTFLLNMQKEAKLGKVINCEFPVKSKVIEDVEDKWGKADKSEYIASAKGTYAIYSKHKAAFGFNKGDQLFEVRSFDSQLSDITLSKVIEVFGKPAHDVKSVNEEIIGYVINTDYKILMVFPNPKTSGDDPKLDHYSVLYPRGTVNSMADDPGRQW